MKKTNFLSIEHRYKQHIFVTLNFPLGVAMAIWKKWSKKAL